MDTPITYHTTLEAMPSVVMAFKHALTFGASTILAMCENSFSALKKVFTDKRLCMHLVQLSFETDLTRRLCNEWKDDVMRRFNSTDR